MYDNVLRAAGVLAHDGAGAYLDRPDDRIVWMVGAAVAECFAEHPSGSAADASLVPLRRVRSTLLCSGISVFRARGLIDAYCANLQPATRDVLLGAIAGTWLPLDVAMQHFEAVDKLGLSPDDAFAIGAASGERIQKSVLQTLVRLAAGAGANPWTVFHTYHRLWERILDGGGFVITRLGPKEARLELRGLAPARFAYFRDAFRGANYAGMRLFASAVYVHEIVVRRSPAGCAFRFSWV